MHLSRMLIVAAAKKMKLRWDVFTKASPKSFRALRTILHSGLDIQEMKGYFSFSICIVKVFPTLTPLFENIEVSLYTSLLTTFMNHKRLFSRGESQKPLWNTATGPRHGKKSMLLALQLQRKSCEQKHGLEKMYLTFLHFSKPHFGPKTKPDGQRHQQPKGTKTNLCSCQHYANPRHRRIHWWP